MKKEQIGKRRDLNITCEKCGASLPLLHPHIMVERIDDDGNLLCEACYQKLYTNKKHMKNR